MPCCFGGEAPSVGMCTMMSRQHPLFLELWQKHGLGFAALASVAGVHVDVIHAMLMGDIPIPAEDAQLVLAAVSSITGKEYTLDNVALLLRDKTSALQSEIDRFLRQERQQSPRPDE